MFSNIAEAVTHNAQRKPLHPALIQEDRSISYAMLNEMVEAQAVGLQSAGVGTGDIVGVALKDTIDHVVSMLAVIRIGAVLLPLDVRWTDDEKSRVAVHFGARLVIVEDDAVSLSGFEVRRIGDLPMPGSAVLPSRDIDRPFILSLSSGTTGRPKGPMLSSRQMLARFQAQPVSLGFSEHDVNMAATPLYFGGGRGFTLGYIYIGGTVVLFPPPYQTTELVAAVERYRVTTLFLVPTIIRRLLAEATGDRMLLGGLRLLLSSGSLLHGSERTAIARHLAPRLINLYASTEGGSVTILLPEDAEDKAATVGRPVFMNKVEVVDESGRQVPVGEVGRIRQQAPWLPSGFYNDPEASREAFQDGWYYPGDLGRLDAEGYLSIVGRSKDMIIRGGVNIYPAEIEAILCAHPAVVDAAVVPRPSIEFGEEPVAFVVTGERVAQDALRQHCQASLAPYKVPRDFIFVAEFPRNTAGKVIKAELAARVAERSTP